MYKNITRPTVFCCFFNIPSAFIQIRILILLFCSTGIISAGRMHLYLDLLFHRDYFSRLDSSPSYSFVPQGLFLADRMHLYLDLLCHRDYFDQPDASLASSFSPQGLFRPTGCITSFLFCSKGIISTGQMHPCLPLFHHRDYFSRSDTSPIAESISARPFRQIPDLFTSTYR